MEFLVNLIVINEKQTNKAIQSLEDNCTFICNNIYFMEGDVGCMLDDGLDFNFINVGVVESLYGLDTKDKIEICEKVFSVNVEKLKYSESKKYRQ